MLIPAGFARGGAVAAAAATATLIAAAPAVAHDSVIGADPEDKGVVSEFPDAITLEFSGEIQDGFNTVALSREVDGQSEVVHSGEPDIEGRFVTLDLPADLDAQPGDYKVGFQIVSSDGHSTKGMTSFSFSPSGAENAQGDDAEATADASKDPVVDAADGMSSTMKVLLALAGVLVVAGAGFGALAKSRRISETNTDTDK
ncbi:hypothetical protein HMPREF3151_05650 [Corynebacterium sp. HMSC05H05]|uniref:copper resistance CopC family protein n=1 Tax=Corynebacterium sp. HMSC05H05 TaxID=1581119 RepID=UPI0008A34ED1|nr:copper resistance CopC family protein [Corynebacterium sp. HMSC05H05]OFT58281.1 hypothetical protein HMPREF3151_05650 [Corynebacterium sp. HMSC05H05]